LECLGWSLDLGDAALEFKQDCVQYHKNGNGKLVKCWHERIAVDYTHKDLKCPACGQQFARETMIRGLPANKIVGGKVILKR
jgi:predicted RNA-binding Zn-ribbon protein involved in translation (DUF1610 family)